MELEIHRTLVLSTSHLPHWIAMGMEPDVGGKFEDFECRYDKVEYGYLVYVCGEVQDFPGEMLHAVHLARANDCRYIRYDCDGPVVESLPKWEW